MRGWVGSLLARHYALVVGQRWANFGELCSLFRTTTPHRPIPASPRRYERSPKGQRMSGARITQRHVASEEDVAYHEGRGMLVPLEEVDNPQVGAGRGRVGRACWAAARAADCADCVLACSLPARACVTLCAHSSLFSTRTVLPSSARWLLSLALPAGAGPGGGAGRFLSVRPWRVRMWDAGPSSAAHGSSQDSEGCGTAFHMVFELAGAHWHVRQLGPTALPLVHGATP